MRGHQPPDVIVDRLDGLGGVHGSYPARFGFGNLLKSVFHPAEKRTVGFLETVTRSRRGGLPRSTPALAYLHWHLEQQGQVRVGAADGEVNDGLHEVQIQLPAVALIGDG